jgi:hypothetical protein
MIDPDKERGTGKTPGEENVEKARAEFEKQISPQLPEDRQRRFRHPGLSRMRFEWAPEDQLVVNRVHQLVEKTLQTTFEDLYGLLFELYSVVRIPEYDPASQEILCDRYGLPMWVKTATGEYEEDWTQLNRRQRERFLFQITTRLVDWQQRAAQFWVESMVSKVNWEERFAIGFESLEPISATKPTEADRRERGNREAVEDRHFAVFQTYLSRRADALVRTMDVLGQRIRDVHMAEGR